jgi:hypothetical protein
LTEWLGLACRAAATRRLPPVLSLVVFAEILARESGEMGTGNRPFQALLHDNVRAPEPAHPGGTPPAWSRLSSNGRQVNSGAGPSGSVPGSGGNGTGDPDPDDDGPEPAA